MDLAAVIEMNFMCYKFFFFLRFEQEDSGPPGFATGNVSVDRSNKSYKQSLKAIE